MNENTNIPFPEIKRFVAEQFRNSGTTMQTVCQHLSNRGQAVEFFLTGGAAIGVEKIDKACTDHVMLLGQNDDILIIPYSNISMLRVKNSELDEALKRRDYENQHEQQMQMINEKMRQSGIKIPEDDSAPESEEILNFPHNNIEGMENVSDDSDVEIVDAPATSD